ncbi:MAG: RlmE family RNA methyltransferase [Candidatus Binataceae bacterium]|nr:RlmE family RNA methyltransferase [Candidatus Binataceae bacterium]
MATYRPHDRFFQKAREKGLPSRAAFKIEELLDRYRLARPGECVLDLGCAPGGWLAILSRAVGSRGRVVGVDLVAVRASFPNVRTITGDICDPAVKVSMAEELGGRAGLLTSDLAPRLSGIADRDQARMDELLQMTLEVAPSVLRPGAAMIAKIFMNANFEPLVARFRKKFVRVDIARTKASRPGSSELYLIAREFNDGIETADR